MLHLLPPAQYGLTVWLAGQLQRPDKPSLVQKLVDGALWGLQQGPPALRGRQQAAETRRRRQMPFRVARAGADSRASAEAAAMTHCSASPEATPCGLCGSQLNEGDTARCYQQGQAHCCG